MHPSSRSDIIIANGILSELFYSPYWLFIMYVTMYPNIDTHIEMWLDYTNFHMLELLYIYTCMYVCMYMYVYDTIPSHYLKSSVRSCLLYLMAAVISLSVYTYTGSQHLEDVVIASTLKLHGERGREGRREGGRVFSIITVIVCLQKYYFHYVSQGQMYGGCKYIIMYTAKTQHWETRHILHCTLLGSLQ